jgi:hypothetical protein
VSGRRRDAGDLSRAHHEGLHVVGGDARARARGGAPAQSRSVPETALTTNGVAPENAEYARIATGPATMALAALPCTWTVPRVGAEAS